ncbi:MAG: TIGR00730 family Rossman fold protein [Bacteroidales bacterium]|nr:TIGR00730 family Rossman fold protein [Bacteroidales bacterium]
MSIKAAVYLGSNPGNDPKYVVNARELGRLLATEGIEVIYGGARVGTMGAMSEGVMEAGGKITGVFPKGFKGRKTYASHGLDVRQKGEGYGNYTYLEAGTFDERIRMMEQMADICIILPGSYGTMHEFFSFFEGNELDRFNKPVAILNVDGYYDPLLQLIRNMTDAAFTGREDLDLFIVAATPEELLAKIKEFFRYGQQGI